MENKSIPKRTLRNFVLRLITLGLFGLSLPDSQLVTGIPPLLFAMLIKGVLLVACCEGYPVKHLIGGSVIAGLSVWGFWYDPRLIQNPGAAVLLYSPLVLGLIWARAAFANGQPDSARAAEATNVKGQKEIA